MKKAKSNRMYYLTVSDRGITKVNSADVPKAKSAVKSGDAQYALHAVFAKDIDDARMKVISHKSEIYKPSNLSGAIRACDAWFESTDKKGRLIHRCFIFKPSCSPKKCITRLSEVTNPYQEEFPFLQFKKINGKYKPFYSGTNDLYEINNIPVNVGFDSPKQGYRMMLYKKKPEIFYPINMKTFIEQNKILPEQISFTEPTQQALFGKLSGYIATCLKFKKNKLGHRYCAKYAPTCGSADEGCRYEPAPMPGKSKRIRKEIEIEAGALAQVLADDANADLERNKQLMREILSYGGIAPHKGGFLKEEYAEIPDKYKRKDGIPLDELAQEMGTNEGALTEHIYQAEAQFRELKEMRGGKLTRKFKKDDFIDEAWNRMQSGRGFMSGFKRYDEQGAIESTIKNIAKFQGKPAYIYSTYLGITSTHMKPPCGQQYYRVNPDGSVDYIEYSKHIPTEERIRNPKYKETKPETKKQMTLFGIPYAESGKFTPDLTKNQIRVRMLNPLLFHKYFIRRSSSPGVQYAMGINDKGKTLTQSVRFSRKLFNLDNAKSWFHENIDRIIKRDMKANTA